MISIFKILSTFFFIFSFVLSLIDSNFITAFYISIIIVNLFIIINYRKNITLLFLYIFIFFYTLSLIPYYFYHIDVSPWKDFNEIKYYNTVIYIHGLFLLIPLISNGTKFDFSDWKFPSNTNKLGFYFFLLVCFLLIQFGVSGTDIFEGGGYAIGESYKSTFFEYFSLFFLLAFYYSSRNNLEILLLVFITLLYVYKSLLFGGRIEVIQLFVLVSYILISDYKFKFSPTKLIFGCIFLYYINIVFVGIRTNPLPLLEGRFFDYLNPFNSNYTDSDYISSNEGDVFQSSARLIGLIENDLLSFTSRIKAFFSFILSIFFPSSWLPEEASLITYKKDIYNSGGGGLISIYFYAFLSWVGPLIISIYILFINKFFIKTKSDYIKLYGIMVFATFPRWFAYNPIILFKLCFWIIPVSFVFNVIIKKLNFENINVK
jgi:hypothetical protein